MLRSLYISLVYGMFLCAGFVAPFVLGLGYVWVDTFQPQNVVYSMLTEIPVAQVMGITAIVAYVLLDRRSPPSIGLVTVLSVLMLIWITYTTLDAPVAPQFAFQKYNWASKTILFSLFMPVLFRSRVQIEAFLQIYVFSLAVQFLPFAAKTLISGGAYGISFGVVAGNSGLSEGSTLSTACLIASLMCLYLARHQTILPRRPIVAWGFLGLFVMCIVAGIGTYERTALVGTVVVLAGLWLTSKRKWLYAIPAIVAGVLFLAYIATSESDWAQRMQTIADPNEGSTYGRILVWKWTLKFVQDHPFGGGFYAYVIDTISAPATADFPDGIVIHGKAFHSIYFEMLGENGWPGLLLFLALVAASAWTLFKVRLAARKLPGMQWCSDMAFMGLMSLAVLTVCGAFISIAFLPEMYYAFALAAMLRQHVRAVQRRMKQDQIRAAERDAHRPIADDDALAAEWGALA
jgi:probable O-glycosylation ligase (exosortase A-associated)